MIDGKFLVTGRALRREFDCDEAFQTVKILRVQFDVVVPGAFDLQQVKGEKNMNKRINIYRIIKYTLTIYVNDNTGTEHYYYYYEKSSKLAV